MTSKPYSLRGLTTTALAFAGTVLFLAMVAWSTWALSFIVPLKLYYWDVEDITRQFTQIQQSPAPEGVEQKHWSQLWEEVIGAHRNICFHPSITSHEEVEQLKVALEQNLKPPYTLESANYAYEQLTTTGKYGPEYARKCRDLYDEAYDRAAGKLSDAVDGAPTD